MQHCFSYVTLSSLLSIFKYFPVLRSFDDINIFVLKIILLCPKIEMAVQEIIF
jgi:hypothetical protein